MFCRLLTPAAGLTFAIASIAPAAVINVPTGQPDIQSAINVAVTDVDEIVVAPGEYFETLNFLGKRITLRSSGGPDVTTINGDGGGSVITFETGETAATIIEGFTITGGTGTFDGIDFVGGGVYNLGANPTFRNCIFFDNDASVGGAVWNFAVAVGSPTFTNCAFIDNMVTKKGGAIYSILANPVLTNCTLTGNMANEGGGIFADMGGTTRFFNSILWDNTAGSFGDSVAGTAIVTHSNIEGGFPGVGNINTNPLFTNAGIGDYTLAMGSPCIDAGDSTAIANTNLSDLNGDPRGVDDPDTADTGIEVFAIAVDMGAYEFQVEGGDCPQGQFAADFTGDLLIDFDDLAILLGFWGDCSQ